MKLPELPYDEVVRSAYATQCLMDFYVETVSRQEGNGTQIVKVHLPRHFFEYMLDFGVMPNVDTGPCESNHKSNAKEPSKHTQLRAEAIEVQTAHRYIENLVMEYAATQLDINTDSIPLSCTTASSVLLRGAHFYFDLQAGPMGVANKVTFGWKSNTLEAAYPIQYMQWLTRHLFSKLPPGTQIQGCTEHKRDNKYIFRAHPSYRGQAMWHDWALFNWGG